MDQPEFLRLCPECPLDGRLSGHQGPYGWGEEEKYFCSCQEMHPGFPPRVRLKKHKPNLLYITRNYAKFVPLLSYEAAAFRQLPAMYLGLEFKTTVQEFSELLIDIDFGIVLKSTRLSGQLSHTRSVRPRLWESKYWKTHDVQMFDSCSDVNALWRCLVCCLCHRFNHTRRRIRVVLIIVQITEG